MSGAAPPEAQSDEWAYRKIAQLIDGVISEMCVRHYDCTTQERQLTSRIAEALEREINRLSVGRVKVEVRFQEIPDKGRGSLEKKIGADLYISVVLPDRKSKGILIQSKWDAAVSEQREKLTEQANEMLDRSEESYVWVYEPSGISSYRAQDTAMRRENAQTPGQLISDASQCKAGDTHIGRNPDLPIDESLRAILEDLGVKRGVAVTLTA